MIKLKEFRSSQHMTPLEMAEQLSISLSQYYKLEEGYKKPSYALMERFAKSFPKADIRLVFFNTERASS